MVPKHTYQKYFVTKYFAVLPSDKTCVGFNKKQVTHCLIAKKKVSHKEDARKKKRIILLNLGRFGIFQLMAEAKDKYKVDVAGAVAGEGRIIIT